MGLFLDSIEHCALADSISATHSITQRRLDAIRSGNDTVNAFVHIGDVSPSPTEVAPDALLPDALIAVKDLIDVADMPTRCGSRAVHREARTDAAVIRALKAQGAVIAGKSHTTEFAMSGWGAGPMGRPLNPVDADDVYYTGGSSNGSAAAVASGLVPAALGTDTGGSVRIPSSWCGITGLKGSPGWVDTQGVAALSQSFDVVGPMARTVAEVTRLYRAMLPTERRVALEAGLREAAERPLPTLLFLDDASLGDIHRDTLAAYRASQALCDTLGYPTTVLTLPVRFADMAQTWAGISEIEGYLNHRELAHDPAASLDETTRANLLRQQSATTAQYLALLNRARDMRGRLERLLTPGQLLVVPTTSSPAVKLTAFDPGRTLGIYTRFVNLIQGCAIAVPNGLSADGLPTSLQFVGAYGQDAVVLHAAAHWQARTDWHEQLRQLHRQQMERRAR